MHCCSYECYHMLLGDKRIRGKGLRAVQRYFAWAAEQMGTGDLRVGDTVRVLRDHSACRNVEEGIARILGFEYDAILHHGVMTVAYVLNKRLLRVGPTGVVLIPCFESGPQRVPRAELAFSSPGPRRASGPAPRFSSEHSGAHACDLLSISAAASAASAAISSAASQRARAAHATRALREERTKSAAEARRADAAETDVAVALARTGHAWQRSELLLAEAHSDARAARTETELERGLRASDKKKAAIALAEARARSRVAAADLARCEANASRLLGESAVATTTEEHRATSLLSALRATTDERDATASELGTVTAQLAGHEERSLSAVVNYLVTDGSADSLLSKRAFDGLVSSDSAVNTDSRQRVDYVRAVNLSDSGLVQLAAGNDPARIKLLERELVSFFQKRADRDGSGSRDEETLSRVLDNLVQAWRNAKRVNDYLTARQILSLFFVGRGRISHAMITQLLSERRPIVRGDHVRVLAPGTRGNAWRRGVCTRVYLNDDVPTGADGERPADADGARADATVADVVDNNHLYDVRPADVDDTIGRRPMDHILQGLDDSRVQNIDSLICTLFEVQAAADHAADRYAGARPESTRRINFTRMPDINGQITADFLRAPSVVTRADGGASTARRVVSGCFSRASLTSARVLISS